MLRRAAALVLVAAAACGGVSLEDLKGRQLDEICDRLVRCGQISDKQECIAGLDRLIDEDQLRAGVANGAITYDDGAAADCLDAAASASCDPSARENRVLPDACRRYQHGHRTAGEPCYFGAECTSGSCSLPGGGCGMACCAGTCLPDPPAPAAVGEPCALALCADGAYCDATQTCAALIAAGQHCMSSDQCTYGTICTGTSTATLACTPPPKAGDPCAAEDASFLTCEVAGLVCDGTQHCVALLDLGASCDQRSALCKADLVCDPTSHACVDAPTDGQPCTDLCAPPDHCAIDGTTGLGTCTAPLAGGTPCQTDTDCASDVCDPSGPTAACADKVVCS